MPSVNGEELPGSDAPSGTMQPLPYGQASAGMAG